MMKSTKSKKAVAAVRPIYHLSRSSKTETRFMNTCRNWLVARVLNVSKVRGAFSSSPACLSEMLIYSTKSCDFGRDLLIMMPKMPLPM